MAGYDKTEIDKIELNIVFFGTGQLGVPVLNALIVNQAPVKLVVTAPDRPAGRGLKIRYSPLKQAAIDAHLPLLQPADVNDPYTIEHIRQHRADIGLIIAYGQKLTPELIAAFPNGIINLHASLLPKYRGAAPINWAIINGEETTGLTVMQIDERIDTGAILAQLPLAIEPTERADELHDRLAQAAGPFVLDTIRQIQTSTLQPIPQNSTKATHAPKLNKAMSNIDWNWPSHKVANLIRGLWPWPAAKSLFVPQTAKPLQVSLARAKALPHTSTENAPGTVLKDFSIACGSGTIDLMELKPAGGRMMTWQEFINGRHVKPGDKFSSLAQPTKTR